MVYLLFIVGLALLVAGGEVLVRGAVGLALRMNISRMVVGVTIVSLGTSAPELLVSLKAAIDGHPDIAIGNVVGSNIFNISFILGFVALVYPIALSKSTLKWDWPVMMFASVIFYLFARNGMIELYEGIIFLILFFIYVGSSIYNSRKQNNQIDNADDIDDLGSPKTTSVWKLLALVGLGSVGLMIGANWFVKGAIDMAESIGVSEHIISVTLVAFGTSVPELVTSVIAAIRKQSDISIGNLVGSNTFNILGMIGVSATVTNIPVNQQAIDSDMIWMLGVALLLLPFLIFGTRLSRPSGVLLTLVYFVYIYFVLK